MRKELIVFALIAGCSRGDDAANNQPSPGAPREAPGAHRPTGRLKGLTGLYQSGDPRSPSRLCIVEHRRTAEFGLVIRGPGAASCSGSGSVRRIGRQLRFTMAGDSRCTLNATIDRMSIVMPATAPPGCAYYCGSPARLTGVRLAQNGGTSQAAMRAKDLVGEPLCSDE
ncbi:MAG: hypothetical protein JWN69_1732 [Alphaproteobacteria bacterium]|nr:hypothetical protein [Alphaproteobacteria bacterium]